MEKNSKQVNVSVPSGLLEELDQVCEYVHTKRTELIRQLIRERVQVLMDTHRFKEWRKEREDTARD